MKHARCASMASGKLKQRHENRVSRLYGEPGRFEAWGRSEDQSSSRIAVRVGDISASLHSRIPRAEGDGSRELSNCGNSQGPSEGLVDAWLPPGAISALLLRKCAGRQINVKDVCCPFAQESAHHYGGWLLSEGQCRRASRGAFSITCHRIFASLPYRALINANRGRGAQLTTCQRAQK
jgi:hypothetical protein